MRTDSVSGDLARMHQPFTFEAVDAKHATSWVGGVVLGGIQPLATVMDHRVAIEVAVGLRADGLQQAPVTQVDQVAFGTWAAGDEQGDR